MTILDKARGGSGKKPIGESTTKKEQHEVESNKKKEQPKEVASDESSAIDQNAQLLTAVESQFKNIMAEFQANTGFSVNTGEQPVDAMIEVLSSKGVVVSIAVLLSYIRHCINHGIKKELKVKIGYNKPAGVPMNFAVNEELLEDIYPGDVIEIN